MCSRVTQFSPVAVIAERFGVPPPLPHVLPRHDAAPGQSLLTILVDPEMETDKRRFATLCWGLVPASAGHAGVGRRVPTITAEALARKPALWEAVGHRRCLVPVDGFYEWRGEGNERRRYWISLVDGGPFAFAGLWTRWYDQASKRIVRSFALITSKANELCAPLAERMPVILDTVHYVTWLGETPAGKSRLLGPLQPFPAERMRAWLVDDSRREDRPVTAPVARIEMTAVSDTTWPAR